MEDFKRPNHSDFMTSEELRKSEFTGIRHNSLTDYLEIWVLGKKEAEMPKRVADANQEAWNRLYADVFALKHVETLPMKGN